MSETVRNLGSTKRPSKRELDREYESFIDDPLTFSIDEVLQILGPRHERI